MQTAVSHKGYFAGLNLYTYVGNNPLNWIDPFGLCKKDTGYYHDSLDEYNLDLEEIEALLGRRWCLRLEETEAYLSVVRNPLLYLLHGGPYSHALPWQLGGFDFKHGYDGKFAILENGEIKTLTGSEFSNYLASYAGYYYGGYVGLGMVSIGGDIFAGTDSGMSYIEAVFHGKDDDLSRRDIVRGYLASKAFRERHTNYRMLTEALGDSYWTSFYMGP